LNNLIRYNGEGSTPERRLLYLEIRLHRGCRVRVDGTHEEVSRTNDGIRCPASDSLRRDIGGWSGERVCSASSSRPNAFVYPRTCAGYHIARGVQLAVITNKSGAVAPSTVAYESNPAVNFMREIPGKRLFVCPIEVAYLALAPANAVIRREFAGVPVIDAVLRAAFKLPVEDPSITESFNYRTGPADCFDGPG